MNEKGLWPMHWFSEIMQELHHVKAAEKQVSTKNAILISITFVAVLALILGIGIVDSTGSLMAGYPLVLPSMGWIILFAYANSDNL